MSLLPNNGTNGNDNTGPGGWELDGGAGPRPADGFRVPRAWMPVLLVCLAAPAMFVFQLTPVALLLALLGLILSFALQHDAKRNQRQALLKDTENPNSPLAMLQVFGYQRSLKLPGLTRDLFLIVVGMFTIHTISLQAQLDTLSMLRFTVALGLAVAIPYLISKYLYRDRAIRFPWRGAGRWGLWHYAWLIVTIAAAWLILPWYFIGSGVYQNWPEVTDTNLIVRLFIGVGAVGIWDELFFICTVLTLLVRHLPFWQANLLQSIVFVSFLWELGYQSFGPILTIPFALMQGFIFTKSKSLSYIVVVHLIFDAVVFLVLVNAHNPGLFNIFLTSH